MADGICTACGAPLVGEFCHTCGQREADIDWRSAGAIARQFWNVLVNLDFKTVRSVAALSCPVVSPRSSSPAPDAVFALYHAAFMFVLSLVMDAVNDAFDGVNLVLLLAAQLPSSRRTCSAR